MKPALTPAQSGGLTMAQDQPNSSSTEASQSREKTMKHYVLSVVQPDGPRPPQERLDKIMSDMRAVMQQMKDSGAWVFSGGLLILRAPDLDAALEWARKTAKAITLPIEVRAFQHLD
jgi:hypothetical protein